VSVGHTRNRAKTDKLIESGDGGDSGGPNKLCIRRGSRSPHTNGQFCGVQSINQSKFIFQVITAKNYNVIMS